MTAELTLLILILPLAFVHVGIWGVVLVNLAYIRRQPSASADSCPSLSVCIPARNEADNLRRLLPTLKDQEYPDLEILVWDDGSEDDTWEVLMAAQDSRLTALQGADPPPGWVGKVHALHQCTRQATGECYLFLDADAELRRPDALRQLVARHVGSRTQVSSGFPRLQGSALLLVSLVPHALLSSLPWPLVPRTKLPALSALNGQCWLVNRDVYHRHEPHAQVKDAVLEDVAIGRYLKRQGHPPTLLDVQDLVAVHMYEGFVEAWRGFRKNAYLLLGGTALLVASEQLGVELLTVAGGILVTLGVVVFTANMLLVIHRHRTVNMSPTPSDQTANSYSFSRSRARWRRICSRYISIC